MLKVNLHIADKTNIVLIVLLLYEDKEQLVQKGWTMYYPSDCDDTYWDAFYAATIATLKDYPEQVTKANVAIALHEHFHLLLGETDPDKITENLSYMRWATGIIRNLRKVYYPSSDNEVTGEVVVEVIPPEPYQWEG